MLNEDVLYGKIEEVIYNDKLLNEMGENAFKLYKPGVQETIYNEIKMVIK